MKKALLFISVFCVLIVPLSAQDNTIFVKTPLSDTVTKISNSLSGYEIKAIASIGEDGILLVDTGSSETATDLKKEILSYGKGEPKIIINTHAHGEHFLGNKVFGNDTIIIGHEKLRARMKAGYFLFHEFPDSALPDIGISEGTMSIFFNGEEIKIIPVAGGHDETDIVVWFTGSKVACVAGLSGGDHFPTLDRSGDSLVYLDCVKKVIELLPEDTTIIASHGKDTSMADYKKYFQTLSTVQSIVEEGLANGKSPDEIKNDERLKAYASYGEGFTPLNGWIDNILRDINIKNGKGQKMGKNYLYEPLYTAYKKEGVKGLLREYTILKRDYNAKEDKGNDLRFFEYALIQIASVFWDSNKHDQSMQIFDLFVKEFPQSGYTFFGYLYIGNYYAEMGNKSMAMKNYNAALKISPENPDVMAAIKNLQK